MTKIWKMVFSACITVACGIALVAFSTYALFDDNVSVENHLQAGDYKVLLKREGYANDPQNTEGEPQNLGNEPQSEPQNTEGEPQNLENDPQSEPQNDYENLNATTAQVLNAIKADNTATKDDLAQQLNKSVSTIKRCILTLREKGYIDYVGVSKNGYWKILK